MPTRSSAGALLVDTSVAVALVVADHEYHRETVRAVGDHRLGLSGHAAFEAFSVLTRLPPPTRRTPVTVARLLAQVFPENRYLSPAGAARLLEQLADAGIAGGSVYNALVGATAVEHRLPLATRDRRAADIYRALGVDTVVIGGSSARG